VGNLSRFADRPFAFVAHYVRMRPIAHAFVAGAVVAAVGCSVGTQYGVRLLVDALSGPGRIDPSQAWTAFWILIALVASDNLLWRIASYISSYVFVAVTGDLRMDLFRHLTGHSPQYFADRLPGMLTSRITATANAV
jgi:ATP-binding cassette, subfamily B, bacterial